jgi:hypothetical protein
MGMTRSFGGRRAGAHHNNTVGHYGKLAREKRESEREREFNADATTPTKDMKELRVGV